MLSFELKKVTQNSKLFYDHLPTLTLRLFSLLMFAVSLQNIHNLNTVSDEPTVGLDLQTRRRLWEILLDLKKQGMTMLLTTHDME